MASDPALAPGLAPHLRALQRYRLERSLESAHQQRAQGRGQLLKAETFSWDSMWKISTHCLLT